MTLIRYNLKGLSVQKKNSVHRILYGYNDHSNKGAYFYRRKGLLESIPYTKISNAAIMTESKHSRIIISALKKNKINLTVINLYKKP